MHPKTRFLAHGVQRYECLGRHRRTQTIFLALSISNKPILGIQKQVFLPMVRRGMGVWVFVEPFVALRKKGEVACYACGKDRPPVQMREHVMFHAGSGEVPFPCCGFCGQQGTCTVAMRCSSGPKGREQVYSTSRSNGMHVKFSMLASSKQAVRNQVVRCPVPQCRVVWQWRLNMASHKSSDAAHMQFPYSPEGLEAWTVGDEEKAILNWKKRLGVAPNRVTRENPQQQRIKSRPSATRCVQKSREVRKRAEEKNKNAPCGRVPSPRALASVYCAAVAWEPTRELLTVGIVLVFVIVRKATQTHCTGPPFASAESNPFGSPDPGPSKADALFSGLGMFAPLVLHHVYGLSGPSLHRIETAVHNICSQSVDMTHRVLAWGC